MKVNEPLSEIIRVRITPSLKLAIQSTAKRLRVPERDVVRWCLSCMLASDDIVDDLFARITMCSEREKSER